MSFYDTASNNGTCFLFNPLSPDEAPNLCISSAVLPWFAPHACTHDCHPRLSADRQACLATTVSWLVTFASRLAFIQTFDLSQSTRHRLPHFPCPLPCSKPCSSCFVKPKIPGLVLQGPQCGPTRPVSLSVKVGVTV